MNVVWGLVVIVTSVVAWGGQLLAWRTPEFAVRVGVADPPTGTDHTFWLDGRAEAAWDTFALWALPVAGALLVVDHGWWPYFALVGGGSYLYFAGRGIFVRVHLRRHGVEIGTRSAIRTALAALTIWGLIAAVTVAAAIVTLEST